MQFLSNSAAEVRNVGKHSYSEVSRPLSASDTVEIGDCMSSDTDASRNLPDVLMIYK